MKNRIGCSAYFVAALAAAQLGCSGSASDPKTLDMQDLNSPGVVETVTRDAKLELRFNTGNFEKEFRGYYVFATTKSLTDLKALVKYPDGTDVTKSGIPRCKDNSAFFEAFGLAAATNDCKGTINVGEATTSSSTTTTFTGASLTGDQTANLADAASDKMSNYQECTEKAAAAISLPITADANGKYFSKGTQKCTVAKAYDPTAKTSSAMANGTSYVVMVMTVATDKYSKVSWSSNIVSDTPAKETYSGNVTLTTATYRTITIPSTFDSVTLGSEVACPATNLCSVTGTNNQSTDAIYIARDGGTSYKQRILISTNETSSIRLLPRGPQTYDPLDPAVTSSRTPNDAAITHTSSSSPYAAAGSVLAVYEDKVFDFVMTTMTTSGSTYRYGKIVIGNITYASSASDSVATIPVTIVMQPKVASTDYFTAK